MTQIIEQKDGASSGEVKLEDILKSIRGIIDDHNSDLEINKFPEVKKIKQNQAKIIQSSTRKITSNTEKNNEDILELTHVVDADNAHDSILSDKVQKKTRAEIDKFTQKLQSGEYIEKNNSMGAILEEMMKPLLKDWMDNNLPRIVEKVVIEEIKKIVPKKKI